MVKKVFGRKEKKIFHGKEGKSSSEEGNEEKTLIFFSLFLFLFEFGYVKGFEWFLDP